MRARPVVVLGSILLLGLAGLLGYVRSLRAVASDVEPLQLPPALATQTVDGIDHLVERYLGPPGYTSLEAQLEALGAPLAREDRYTAIPDPTFGVGSWIEIVRATPVTIADEGRSTTYRTWQPTVGQLIDEAGIALDGDDRIAPTLETQLAPDLGITITRIGVSEEFEMESISFKQVKKQDAALEKGTTKVTQRGQAGLRKKTYRVTRENGVVTSRVLIANEIAREPVEEITVEGTKVVSYGSGQATWYALRSGMQAAHNTLPFGTKVRVTSVASGKSVDVVITDRGIQGSALIDLTADAFREIAPLGAGRIQVRIDKDYD